MAIKKLKFDADYYYDKAEKYMDVGDPVNAVDYFCRSLALEPFNPWTIAEIATCYSSMGQHMHALAWYYRALAYEKNCDVAFLGIINFMASFGQSETAAYYLKLSAETAAFDRITEEFDVDLDYDNPPENEEKRPIFKLAKQKRSEKYLSRAKRSLVTGDVKAAIENLERVEKDTPEFSEAAYYASLIRFDEGDFDKALDYGAALLEKDPDDSRGYVIRVAVYSKTGDLVKRDEAIAALMKIKPKNYVEAMGVAICFSDISLSQEAEHFYEIAAGFLPYEKNALVPLAQCYHNNGKHDKAKEVMVKLCKLNPEDYSCAWLARRLAADKGRVEMLSEIPGEAKLSLSKEILGELSKYSTVDELERAFDASDELYEKITMLFSSTDFETIGYAAEVFALSGKLRPFLRQIPVRMDAPFAIKQKCVSLLLTYEKKREFAAYVGDVIRFFSPRLPKCTKNSYIVAAYWKAYSTLSLLGLGCEKNLFSVMRRWCERIERIGRSECVNEIAAILAMKAFEDGVGVEASMTLHKLSDFCELFGAETDLCEEIMKNIGD